MKKKKIKKNIKKIINFTSYYLYEKIVSKLPSFCKTKKFQDKENLVNQSFRILKDKLDIVLYIRNMILFDSINQIYLENPYIIDFLSRPIIYLNKKEEKKVKKEFYENSDELDIDILYERIRKLILKPEKTKIEQNIIFLLKEQLNELK